MPEIYFGTYKLTSQEELTKALKNAIDSNIKCFDFAELYKNQEMIGIFFHKIFSENLLKREDFWFTSKVSFRVIPKGEDAIRKSIEKTLTDLKTDYIDLMLIHAPTKNNVLCWNILNEYKQKLIDLYTEHLAWLRPQDRLQRATVGFESAINFLQAADNSRLIPKFWEKMGELDQIRNENILTVIPELKALK